MSQGKILGVAIALVALAGLSLGLKKNQYGQAQVDPRIGQEVVSKQLILKADSIAIKKGAESLELKKHPSGLWFLHGNKPFLAKANQVNDLLQDLLELKIQRRISTDKKQHVALGLDEAQVGKLLIAAGDSSLTLHKGKQRSKGQGVYLAFAGENTAYVTDKNVRLLSNPNMWSEKDLFGWKEEQITTLTIHTLSQQKIDLGFARKEQSWSVVSGGQDGDLVEENNLKELLNAILETTFTKKFTATESFAKGDLYHRYQLTTATGGLVDLQLFQNTTEKDKKKYYFQLSLAKPTGKYESWLSEAGQQWVFELAQHKFEALVKKPTDFIAAAEAPKP